jgi:hypothetical protein
VVGWTLGCGGHGADPVHTDRDDLADRDEVARPDEEVGEVLPPVVEAGDPPETTAPSVQETPESSFDSTATWDGRGSYEDWLHGYLKRAERPVPQPCGVGARAWGVDTISGYIEALEARAGTGRMQCDPCDGHAGALGLSRPTRPYCRAIDAGAVANCHLWHELDERVVHEVRFEVRDDGGVLWSTCGQGVGG